MSELQNEIKALINKRSRENISDTPDWILAGYLNNCLQAFEQATIHREHYYGRELTEKNNSEVEPERAEPVTK